MVKFVNVLKYKVKKLKEAPNQDLTATILLEAEVLWVKEAQKTLDVWNTGAKVMLMFHSQ